MRKSAIKKLNSYIPSENSSKLVKIGEASHLLNVSIDTLRRWEKRGWLLATKTPGGTRLYDKDQLQKLNPHLNRGPKPLLSPLLQKNDNNQTSPISLTSDTPVLKTIPALSTENLRVPEDKDDLKQPFQHYKFNLVTLLFMVIVFSLLSVPSYLLSKHFKEEQTESTLTAKLQNNPLTQASDLTRTLASVFSPDLSQKLFGGNLTQNLDNTISPAQQRDSEYSNRTNSPISQISQKSLIGSVLAEATPAAFLQINLNTEINGDASVSGTLTAPNIVYRLIAGNNIAITGDPQRPTIASTVTIDNATTTTAGIASFSDSFFTVTTAGAVALKSGGITTTQILDGTITNGDLASPSITISPGSGLSGGGAVSLGGSVTLTNSGVTSITGTANQVIASASTGDVTLSLPQDIATASTPEFSGLLLSGSTSGTITLNANATTTDYTLTLPANDGTNNYVLSTDGNGNTSWVSVGGGACSNCVLTDPSATQTITPSSATAIGLSVAQALGGSVDIFNVTSNGGGTKYLQVDDTGAFALTSSGGLNVTTTGALTGVASIDTILTSATALTFAGAGSVAAGGTSNLALDAGTSGTVNIAGVSTGDVNIAGGSASTGCTITNSSGNLACSGTITSASTAVVLGSGTLNRVAKFTATGSTIGDSVLSDDGTTLTYSGTGGLTFSGVGADLTFTNGESINNDVDGTISLNPTILTLSGTTTITATSLATLTTAATLTASGNLTVQGTTGLTLSGTGADLIFANGETIDNDSNNQINLGLGTSGTLLLTSTTTASITNSAGALNINAQATGLNLQADGVIDVNVAGGSGATGCTFANSTGNLTCSGNITGSSSGTAGFWTRTSTTLSPATANDIVSIPTTNITGADLAVTNTGIYTGTGIFNLTANSLTSGTAALITANGISSGNILSLASTSTAAASNTQKGLNIALSGTNSTSAQTTYGAYISNAHGGTTSTNVGLYASATGGNTANYAAIFAAGNVGIGTTTPTATLEINDNDSNTSTSGLTFTNFTCSGTDKLTANGSGVIVCSADQTGSGSGNIVDNIYDTLGAGSDAGGRGITNLGAVTIPTSNTTGADLAITNTGVYTGTGIFNLTANSATTGNLINLSGTGLTTGEVLNLDATYAPSDGSTNEAIDINITHTPTSSADNFQAINLTTTDGTALANTVYNLQGTLTLTGNAAKTGVGLYSTVTTSSTTSDTIIAADLATSATGIIGATTRNNYGLRTQPASTSANTAGTQNIYGIYSAPSGTLAAGSTENIYGGYFGGTATVASGTINRYGLYVANASMNSTGASTQYGLYLEDITGADTNIEIAFASTSPTVTVADGGTITISDGTNTLCTIADAGTTGNLSCTGNITGSSSGTSGFWTRTSTTLSPATANDIVSIATTNTTGADLAITNTGIYTGTGIFKLTANSAIAGTLASISDSAIMTTTGKLLDLTANAATSTTGLFTQNATGLVDGYAHLINVAGTTTLTTGGALNIDGPTGAANLNATTGLVNISSTGAITNTTAGAASGSLFQITGNGAITPTLASISDTSIMTTTGKLLDLTANAATSTTGLFTQNATGLVDGYAQAINVNGTTTLTTGGALKITGPTSTATMNATTGLLNITTTGAFTNSTAGAASGSLLQLNANGAITPTIASISDTSIMTTTGKLLDLTANAATSTTGLFTQNATGLVDGYAHLINVAGTTTLTTGGALNIDGPTGAATMNATTGLVNISSTGAITNTTAGAASGSLFQITGNGAITPTLASISDTSIMTTTGKLLDLTANAATSTTGLLTMNATGLVDGYAQAINVNGTTTLTSGGALKITGPTSTAALSGTAGGLVSINAAGVYTSANNAGLLNVNATATTAGVVQNIEADALTTGQALRISNASAALTTGSLLLVTTASTGTINTNGIISFQETADFASTSNNGFVNVLANTTTAGTIQQISGTALTTGVALKLTGPTGGSTFTTGSLLQTTTASTGAINTNGIISFQDTGAFTSTSNNGFVNILANSTLTGTIANISGTGITSGTALNIVGSSSTGVTGSFTKIAADVGSAGILLDLSPDFSGSAVTGYGAKVTATDSTGNANTDYGYYGSLALSGNANKTGIGIYSTVTSSSTTAETTLAALDLATSVTGATSGTRNIYGARTQPVSTAVNTGGTDSTYGIYSAPSSTLANGSTENVYGGYFKSTGTVAAGTVNSYGVYVANPTMNTTGTSTKYGLYVEDVTAGPADNNYAAVFAGGNVGMGTTTPATKLDIADSVTAKTLVQVSSPASDITFGADTTINSTETAVSTTSNSGQAVVSVSSESGFAAGDTVVIIQMLGTGAGQYEERAVSSTSAGSITMTANLTNTYTAGGSNKAQVIKYNSYKNVTIDNTFTLTAPAWDGTVGGVLYFKATGTVTNNGTISMTGKGFRGGAGGALGAGGAGGAGGGANGTAGSPGVVGEGIGTPTAATGGGGGGGGTGGTQRGGGGGRSGASGAGGSYGAAGTTGNDGANGGIGGNTGGAAGSTGGAGGIAPAALGCADFSSSTNCISPGSGGDGGSGGGGGGEASDSTSTEGRDGGAGSNGAAGGAGGGIIAVFATTITNSGTIASNGSAGSNAATATAGVSGSGSADSAGGGGGGAGGEGGGGAGGAVWISAPTVTVGTVTATGGAVGTGGTGGAGGSCGSAGTDGGGGGGGGDNAGAVADGGCSSTSSDPGSAFTPAGAGAVGRIKCDNSAGTCSGGSPAIGSPEVVSSSPSAGATDMNALLYVNGNVGIGTTTPTAPLSVSGDLNNSDVLQSISSIDNSASICCLSNLDLINTNQTTNTWTKLGFADGTNGTSSAAIFAFYTDHSNNYGDLSFVTRSSAGYSDKLRILSGGNIGIGTTIPTRTVEILGIGNTAVRNSTLDTTDQIALYIVGNPTASANPVLAIEINNKDTGNAESMVDFISSNDGLAPRLDATITNTSGLVQLNGFSGGHYGKTNELLIDPGMLVSMTGENSNIGLDGTGDIIYGTKKTILENDPKAIGTYGGKYAIAGHENENTHLITAVGNGLMWVVDNGQNVNPGDYLVSSSTPGHAMVDPETYPVSHVIAKAAQPIDWSTVTETVDGKKHKKVFVLLGFFAKNNALATNITQASNPGTAGNVTFGTSITSGTMTADIGSASSGNNLFSLDAQGYAVTPKLKTDHLTVGSDIKVGGLVSASDFALDASVLNQVGALASVPVNAEGKVSVADAINGISNKIQETSNKLDEYEASSSAKIAENTQIAQQAITQAQSLNDKVASTSSSLSTLSQRITDLLASFGGGDSATDSAVIPSATEGSIDSSLIAQNDKLNLTPPELLIASDSASLTTPTLPTSLPTLTISETLKSLGETFLGQTTIAGDASFDGTFSITNGNSLNSLTTLYIQNNPLTSLVDFFNGKVTIDKNGTLTADSLALGAESLGEAVIPASQTEITIPTSLISPTSRIFLTPTTPLLGNLYLGVKTAGVGFKVNLSEANFTDVKFNWLIIQSKEESN